MFQPWHRHPGVRSDGDLSPGERAADVMRNGMGSWAFVFAASLFLAVWMGFNRSSGFDPYPFILLNLVLSCLAAMQGAILLIAAKRADQIASELAMHDYEADCATKDLVSAVHELLEENTELTRKIAVLTESVHQMTVSNPGGSGPVPRADAS